MKNPLLILIFVLVSSQLGNASTVINNVTLDIIDTGFINPNESVYVNNSKEDEQQNKKAAVLLVPDKRSEAHENLHKEEDLHKEVETNGIVRVAQHGDTGSHCNFSCSSRTPAKDSPKHVAAPTESSLDKNLHSPTTDESLLQVASVKNRKNILRDILKSQPAKREEVKRNTEINSKPQRHDLIKLVSKNSDKQNRNKRKKYYCYCVEEECKEKMGTKPPFQDSMIIKNIGPNMLSRNSYSRDYENNREQPELLASEYSSGENNHLNWLHPDEDNSMEEPEYSAESTTTEYPYRSTMKRRVHKPFSYDSENHPFGEPTKINIPLIENPKWNRHKYKVDTKLTFAQKLESVFEQKEVYDVLPNTESENIFNDAQETHDYLNNKQSNYDQYNQNAAAPYIEYHVPYYGYTQYPQYPQYGYGMNRRFDQFAETTPFSDKSFQVNTFRYPAHTYNAFEATSPFYGRRMSQRDNQIPHQRAKYPNRQMINKFHPNYENTRDTTFNNEKKFGFKHEINSENSDRNKNLVNPDWFMKPTDEDLEYFPLRMDSNRPWPTNWGKLKENVSSRKQKHQETDERRNIPVIAETSLNMGGAKRIYSPQYIDYTKKPGDENIDYPISVDRSHDMLEYIQTPLDSMLPNYESRYSTIGQSWGKSREFIPEVPQPSRSEFSTNQDILNQNEYPYPKNSRYATKPSLRGNAHQRQFATDLNRHSPFQENADDPTYEDSTLHYGTGVPQSALGEASDDPTLTMYRQPTETEPNVESAAARATASDRQFPRQYQSARINKFFTADDSPYETSRPTMVDSLQGNVAEEELGDTSNYSPFTIYPDVKRIEIQSYFDPTAPPPTGPNKQFTGQSAPIQSNPIDNRFTTFFPTMVNSTYSICKKFLELCQSSGADQLSRSGVNPMATIGDNQQYTDAYAALDDSIDLRTTELGEETPEEEIFRYASNPEDTQNNWTDRNSENLAYTAIGQQENADEISDEINVASQHSTSEEFTKRIEARSNPPSMAREHLTTSTEKFSRSNEYERPLTAINHRSLIGEKNMRPEMASQKDSYSNEDIKKSYSTDELVTMFDSKVVGKPLPVSKRTPNVELQETANGLSSTEVTDEHTDTSTSDEAQATEDFVTYSDAREEQREEDVFSPIDEASTTISMPIVSATPNSNETDSLSINDCKIVTNLGRSSTTHERTEDVLENLDKSYLESGSITSNDNNTNSVLKNAQPSPKESEPTELSKSEGQNSSESLIRTTLDDGVNPSSFSDQDYKHFQGGSPSRNNETVGATRSRAIIWKTLNKAVSRAKNFAKAFHESGPTVSRITNIPGIEKPDEPYQNIPGIPTAKYDGHNGKWTKTFSVSEDSREHVQHPQTLNANHQHGNRFRHADNAQDYSLIGGSGEVNKYPDKNYVANDSVDIAQSTPTIIGVNHHDEEDIENLPTRYYTPTDRRLTYIKNHPTVQNINHGFPLHPETYQSGSTSWDQRSPYGSLPEYAEDFEHHDFTHDAQSTTFGQSRKDVKNTQYSGFNGIDVYSQEARQGETVNQEYNEKTRHPEFRGIKSSLRNAGYDQRGKMPSRKNKPHVFTTSNYEEALVGVDFSNGGYVEDMPEQKSVTRSLRHKFAKILKSSAPEEGAILTPLTGEAKNRGGQQRLLSPSRERTFSQSNIGNKAGKSFHSSINPTHKYDSRYFGKIKSNGLMDFSVNERIPELMNTNLFYVGNGVKIPLEIYRQPDGSYALSISMKLCENFMMRNCPCCVSRDGDILEENVQLDEAETEHYSSGDTESTEVSFEPTEDERFQSITKKRYIGSTPGRGVVMRNVTPVKKFVEKYNLTVDLQDQTLPHIPRRNIGIRPDVRKKDPSDLFKESKIVKPFANKYKMVNRYDNEGTEEKTTNGDESIQKIKYNHNSDTNDFVKKLLRIKKII